MKESAEIQLAHKLKDLYDAPRTSSYQFTEWILQRRPVSMKAFCLSFNQNESNSLLKPIDNKYIWVNDEAFVRYYSPNTDPSSYLLETRGIDHNLPPALQRISYVIILKRNKEETEYYFHVHALSRDAADACLQLLCSLKDTYFSNMMVSNQHLRYYSSPGGADQTEKYRFDAFYNIEFSGALQRTMAALSKRIFLCRCYFRDGGAEVLDVLRATGPDFVPFDLYLEGGCPFDKKHWEEFLILLSKEKTLVNKLDLRGFSPRRSLPTSELAFARVGNLIFRDHLEDTCGIKVIESVQCGRSPDGLDFKGFDSVQEWDTFCRSLASAQCRLKRLKLYDFDAERDHALDENTLTARLIESLCHALNNNNSLVELAIDFSINMIRDDFLRVMRSVKNHKALRTISFQDCNAWSRADRIVLTEEWVDILRHNGTIQNVLCDDELYDEQLFEELVQPQLLRNKYMTLIHRSQQMHDVRSRAYFVGRWIEESAGDLFSPHITFMLLRMNTDVLLSYRNSYHKRTQ
ncbi:hypothetical protein FisN_18Lh219 [Fistulifera solaris]|uniref:Uncharacterized protein n=1 Tax=Fistulifera solaris TaxID=1519565 RepID=A0A1Z5JUW5_FISSO|nr:hypothetical protein FisN_18Lh219 [Fistulifera solaris]|eukprot:GAX17568.1 hypothetical protein FisN_18Lh219 [Fistulifera solaris]